MRRVAIWLLALVASGGCGGATDSEEAGSRLISSGTFFNMCVGYCVSELVVDSTTAVLTETSHQPERYPRRTRSLELTRDEADRLHGLADLERLRSVAGVHGCPDCADGGGEWVEIRWRVQLMEVSIVRATFDYGRVLEPIEELQTELRALRARFQNGG
jgi:hypothetical protein